MSLVHYCIWGLCESWEYCCGDNECCKEADFNFLLLTAFILGALLFVALFCICIYCGSRRSYYAPFLKKYLKISYTLMSSQTKNKVTDQNETTKESVIQIQTTKVSL
ncbi:uncharacterized protein LOC143352678 [Halictus rubicundus]|uniref:uncharacterized protein LOC143352678 n=1 Tax=Halictus rubicundus TaxID=77578 RepID=UPI004036172E